MPLRPISIRLLCETGARTTYILLDGPVCLRFSLCLGYLPISTLATVANSKTDFLREFYLQMHSGVEVIIYDN